MKLNVLLLLLTTCSIAAAQTKKPVSATVSPPALKQSLLKGKVVYASYCITCHQETGNGIAGVYPPLIKTAYVNGDKKKLIRILLKGLNEDIIINGSHYTSPMPAFDYLKDQEIADVLTYIRKSFKNAAAPVSAAEVKASR